MLVIENLAFHQQQAMSKCLYYYNKEKLYLLTKWKELVFITAVTQPEDEVKENNVVFSIHRSVKGPAICSAAACIHYSQLFVVCSWCYSINSLY